MKIPYWVRMLFASVAFVGFCFSVFAHIISLQGNNFEEIIEPFSIFYIGIFIVTPVAGYYAKGRWLGNNLSADEFPPFYRTIMVALSIYVGIIHFNNDNIISVDYRNGKYIYAKCYRQPEECIITKQVYNKEKSKEILFFSSFCMVFYLCGMFILILKSDHFQSPVP